jgi:hypothetical protein
VKGDTAPGEVDRRDLGRQGGWGDLPPAEEAKAKQQIARDFPPQYRQAVEEYFKRLAERRRANE